MLMDERLRSVQHSHVSVQSGHEVDREDVLVKMRMRVIC